MTTMDIEPRIIPFDIDYLRARSLFHRQKHELVIVRGSKAYGFKPALPRDAARMSFYKILIDKLKELPEEERMSLRLSPEGISPTHYTITRENKGVELQFHLRPGTYQAMTTIVDGDEKTAICNLRDATLANFRTEIKKALRQSYQHLGLEAYLR